MSAHYERAPRTRHLLNVQLLYIINYLNTDKKNCFIIIQTKAHLCDKEILKNITKNNNN